MRTKSTLLAAIGLATGLTLLATAVSARPGWPDCDVCLLPLATGNSWQFSSNGRPSRNAAVRWEKGGAHYVEGLLDRGAWLSSNFGLSYDDVYLRDMSKGTAYPMFLVDAKVGTSWRVTTAAGTTYDVAYAADQLTLALANGKRLYDVRRYTMLPAKRPAQGDDIVAIDFAPGLGPVRLLTYDGRTHLLTGAILGGRPVF